MHSCKKGSEGSKWTNMAPLSSRCVYFVQQDCSNKCQISNHWPPWGLPQLTHLMLQRGLLPTNLELGKLHSVARSGVYVVRSLWFCFLSELLHPSHIQSVSIPCGECSGECGIYGPENRSRKPHFSIVLNQSTRKWFCDGRGRYVSGFWAGIWVGSSSQETAP